MSKKSLSNAGLTKTGIALILIGGGIILCLTIVGAIVGVPMILVGGLIVGKPRKVWKCSKCKIVIDRA